MTNGGDHLSVFDSTRTYSTYESSDTQSITSSEDDHWTTQIGGYNEMSPAFPPPPVTLLPPPSDRLIGAATLAENELEAMLESGFDDRSPNASPVGTSSMYTAAKYQLSDPSRGGSGYAPLTRTATPPTNQPTGYGYGTIPPPIDVGSPITPTGFGSMSSGVSPDWKGHAKKRSGSGPKEKYGPLGPLDPRSGRF